VIYITIIVQKLFRIVFLEWSKISYWKYRQIKIKTPRYCWKELSYKTNKL